MRLSVAILIMLLCSSCRKNGLPPTTVKYHHLTTDSLQFLQTNIPTDTYNDLCFVNGTTGYAVSVNGNIVKTMDGGLGWTKLTTNVTFNLTSVQFIDAQTGYVTGGDATDGYLLKTTDGGSSWQKLPLSLPEPGWPTGMFFVNASKGFIAGKNFFRKTIDGGSTWNDIPGVTAENFADVSFSSASNGFATAAGGKLFVSSNGGDAWYAVKTSTTEPLGKIYHSGAGSFSLSPSGLVDLSTGKLSATAHIPQGVVRLLFLNDKNCIGIGQHYKAGFFPYGDIHLTNSAWETSSRKTYQPFSEALELKTMAKKAEGKVLMIGRAVQGTAVIELSY
ncbi:MAG TPA: YCF48-related protein [Chitinophagaceae bacterium]|nr:YCF48-related protein [Chitinophagaceae bacterium]